MVRFRCLAYARVAGSRLTALDCGCQDRFYACGTIFCPNDKSTLTSSNTLQTSSFEAGFVHALRDFIGACSFGVGGLVLHLVA